MISKLSDFFFFFFFFFFNFHFILPELWPFKNLGNLKNCQQVISKTIRVTGLNLGQLVGDDK